MLGDISGRFSLLPLALVLLASGTGCGGCNDSSLICDDAGNCQICDGYGCTPAGSGGTGAAGTGASGNGGAGTGAAGTGADGSGGEGTGASGSGGEGAGGAGNDCDPAITTCACDPAADPDTCADGTQCIGGLCLEGCNHSFECGDDKVCANGLCVEGCDDDSPCESEFTICENGVCVVDPLDPECDDPTDCDPQVCEGGLCVDPCELNDDCDAGEICNSGTGTCFPDPSPAPMCDANTTCPGVGQVCWADGFCRYPCNDVGECKLIDARFDHCDAGVCKTDLELNPECDLDTPCPNGEDCISNKCF